MLQAADIGSGYTVSDDVQGEDHGSIGMLMSYCGQTGYSTAFEHRADGRRRNFHRSEEIYIHEEVSRYESTWAAHHLSDLRSVLSRCQSVDIMGDPSHRVTLTIVATNFTGDESALIKESFGNQTQYHVIVRQGDVEARLRIHIGATESAARSIATHAAQRLCQATPTC